MLKPKPKIKLTISENSIKKYKRKLNSSKVRLK
jgi:hypothetical protein